MCNRNHFLNATFALLALLYLPACYKPGKDFDPRDGTNEYRNCRINQITNGTLVRTIAYNSDNDPVSITNSSAGTGNPHLSFAYNHKGDLIEYAGLYSDLSNFEFLHHYGYRHNRITTDTMWVFGSLRNPEQSWSKKIKYLEYDELNRVISDSDVYIYPVLQPFVWRYTYNESGNLVGDGVGPDTYDSKMNPHRTNKIWMFIDRNYSLNNREEIYTYNSSGLPLTLSGNAKGYRAFIFGYYYFYGDVRIVYDCR